LADQLREPRDQTKRAAEVYELIGAGMLILAPSCDGRGFPLDYDELERWTRVG
jgi:hypothetical protein